jgi:hypothetical protein
MFAIVLQLAARAQHRGFFVFAAIFRGVSQAPLTCNRISFDSNASATVWFGVHESADLQHRMAILRVLYPVEILRVLKLPNLFTVNIHKPQDAVLGLVSF